jgi:hypothetical protein
MQHWAKGRTRDMQKWMYAVIAIVAVVAVLGVILGVRYLAPDRPPVDNGGPVQNGESINGAPDNGENGAPDGNGNGVPDVGAATSLQFSVDLTNGETGQFTWLAKNIGADDFRLRLEWRWDEFEEGIIIDGQLHRIWHLEEGAWIEEDMVAEYWDVYWDLLMVPFERYVMALRDWTHGDWTYTDPVEGYLVRIYDITVNPELDDALFEP